MTDVIIVKIITDGLKGMKILHSTCNLQRNAKRAREGEGGREKQRESVEKQLSLWKRTI